jgi:hypothetical protein
MDTEWLSEDERVFEAVTEDGEPLHFVLIRLVEERQCGFHMSAELEILRRKVAELEAELATLPAVWREDSSLETWFPLTAEELKRLRAELARLRKDGV